MPPNQVSALNNPVLTETGKVNMKATAFKYNVHLAWLKKTYPSFQERQK